MVTPEAADRPGAAQVRRRERNTLATTGRQRIGDGMESTPPILDLELADQFFAVSAPEDQAQMRELTLGLRQAVLPRFVVLRQAADGAGLEPAACERKLHQLRGVIANFGLSAAAHRLRRLEQDWRQLAAGERTGTLNRAADDFEAGLKALASQYPYLRD